MTKLKDMRSNSFKKTIYRNYMPIIPLSLSCETCMSLHYGSKKQREDFGNMKKNVSQGKKITKETFIKLYKLNIFLMQIILLFGAKYIKSVS